MTERGQIYNRNPLNGSQVKNDQNGLKKPVKSVKIVFFSLNTIRPSILK